MKLTDKYRILTLNILIAIAISLILHFSYLVLLMLSPTEMPPGGAIGGPMGGHRPPPIHIFQVLYFTVLAFILLTICTARPRTSGRIRVYLQKIVITAVISAGFYLLYPQNSPYGFELTLFSPRVFDPMLLLKCSFTWVVSILYGIIYDLFYQKQKIVLENERLKSENLEATYSSLVSQVNPHFFFNSLNSLSMLVREKLNDKALNYIDRLSDTFRYILRNSNAAMTTVGEELEFVRSYQYLLEVRYEGKISFVIDVPSEYLDQFIPSLSLQPLLENAVKHNTITRKDPLEITVRAENGSLVISNPLKPKLKNEETTGIGLSNLAARYVLLTGRDITIEKTQDMFVVILPIIQVP